jgi:hypothetical protein
VNQPQTFEGQFLRATERADSPKNELFGAVTRLKPGLMELGHPFHQRLSDGAIPLEPSAYQ